MAMKDIAKWHDPALDIDEGVLERLEQGVIDRIPELSDEHVLRTRETARNLGSVAWRIECACDAEILKRTHARRGRGNVDTAGIGVKATVKAIAAEVGVHPNSIYRNAQIHNTFFEPVNGLGAQTNLPDKQFYEEALRATNPHAAIEVIADNRAANVHYSTRDARRDVQAMKVVRAVAELPPGKHDVLYADPPWRYEFSSDPADEIENHYPTMDLDEICALPVADVAADDSVLFLWTTSPKLIEAATVLEAWGFTYRTSMVWDKEHIGMGYYARQQHEYLLIGTRGTPGTPAQSNRPPSVVRMRKGKHSAKPALFYDLIESMYPDRTYLELFARAEREGWKAWGFEATAA